MFAAHALAPISIAETPSETPLTRLLGGSDLSADAAEALFADLVAGRLDAPEIAGMLVALRLKGETAAELIGAARALKAAALPVPRPDYLFADTCGTGGDGSGSINISTAVAFVAAAAGLPIAKHGNRSVTSACGSADVLEALGVKLDVPAAVSRRALDEAGVCFLFAPAYHPGLRHAGPVRRALKVRTVMNLLGPCLNPAAPPVQLLGVADPAMLMPVAETLAALGTKRALVVHGAGLDEVALHGATQAVQVAEGRCTPLTLTPEEAGLERMALAPIRGGAVAENAERLAQLLKGYGTETEAAIVALNAGALLMIAGLADTLADGRARAADVLASGAPYDRLARLAEISHA